MKRGLCVVAVGVFIAASVLAPSRASAAGVSVVQGDHYGTRIFPDNFFTVPDANQVSGLRVNFRAGIDYAACDTTNYSVCDAFAKLDQLDGFDPQPRVTVPFTGTIELTSVDDSDFYITDDQRRVRQRPAPADVRPGRPHAGRHQRRVPTRGHGVSASTSPSASRTPRETRQRVRRRMRTVPLHDADGERRAGAHPPGDGPAAVAIPSNAYALAGFPGAVVHHRLAQG